MAWAAPRTWATSELVTSSLMNTHLRDNLLALKAPYARVTTDIPVNSTTTETTLLTFSLAANDLSANGGLWIKLWGSYTQNASTSGTFRLKIGATTIASRGGIFGLNSASEQQWWVNAFILAQNSTSSQDGVIEYGSGPTAFVGGHGRGTAAENTTGALTVLVSYQWAASTASFNLNAGFCLAMLTGP